MHGWFLRKNSVVGVARNAFALAFCAAISLRTAPNKLWPTSRMTWWRFGIKTVHYLPGRSFSRRTLQVRGGVLILEKRAAKSRGTAPFEGYRSQSTRPLHV